MARPDLVRVRLEDGTEKSVGASFAKSHGLKVLDESPFDGVGRVVRTMQPVTLRGKALDAALTDAGLSTTGSADAKRQRLSDHQMSVAAGVGTASSTTGGAAAMSHEESK
jgi:hypothetical protein